ncbi:MAG: ParB N-terminal domain-containing protein [Desulfovibrio sp.]|nr:ParB N-terminal domain-containing protein [Desulfovibrio sp.]
MNSTLGTLSSRLYGDDFRLLVVQPSSLVILAKNARVFDKGTFQQLTANIRQDGRLSSVPLCWRQPDGSLEVLSGNHRVQAAIEAGVEQILVMVIECDIPKARRIAIQLSHNALVGSDDPTILAELWAEIDDIEAKLYAGLSEEQARKLEKIDLVGFTTPQIFTRTISLAFIDTEMAHFNDVLEQLSHLPVDEVRVAALADFDRFFAALEGVKQRFDMRNNSLAILKMCELCEQALAQQAEGGAA